METCQWRMCRHGSNEAATKQVHVGDGVELWECLEGAFGELAGRRASGACACAWLLLHRLVGFHCRMYSESACAILAGCITVLCVSFLTADVVFSHVYILYSMLLEY